MTVPPRRRARAGAMFARSLANRDASPATAKWSRPVGVQFGILATEVGAGSRAGASEAG